MKPLKALIVEDSKDDAALLLRHLSYAGYEVQSAIVQTPAEMKAALSGSDWDIILSDYTMPHFSGLEALSILRESGLDIPFIIVSGAIGEDVAVEAMRFGSHDYLMKDNLKRLEPAIEREMLNAAIRQERRQSEEALRRSEASLANAQRMVHIGSWETNLLNNQLFWSDEVYHIFGVPKAEFGATLESFLERIHPEDKQLVQSATDAALSQFAAYNIEHRIIRPNGDERVVCEIGEVTFDESGKPIRFTGTVQDITERKRIERALEESAKREGAIIRNALDVICTMDAQGNFASISPACLKVWGYQPEELIGKPYIEFVTPGDVAETNEAALKIMSGIETRDFENRYLHKNGSLVDVRWTAFWSETDRLMFCVAHDITERKIVDKSLREAEVKYRNLIESSPGIIIFCASNPPYSTSYVSPNVKTLGYSPEEWYAKSDMWSSILHTEDRERVLREFESATENGLETELEYRTVARDGAIHWWQDKGRFVLDKHGDRTGWQGVILDITVTKELEQQLQQAQKLESVGLLAGGIAHDFNNMLTAINGYSELTLRSLKADDPLRAFVEEIKSAGQRSALLTHQLLAFSRRQVLQPVVIDLNETLANTIKMLQRLIGEDVQLSTSLNPKAGRVKVDPGQFTQIIMNLAVNARDAMPQGGKLTIETANTFLDPKYSSQYFDVLPGAYVMLAVSDTGEGMSNEIKQHIFDPFFTTKEIGYGTGLGLATVYGIVKQSGGNIEVFSEEGVGTTFKIYLPRVIAEIDETIISDTSSEMLEGTETILLVEDEEMVRNLSREILESYGYTVVEAKNGVEALSIFETEDWKVDLLLTDVVMPLMGGRELVEKLTVKLPNLLILYTSGYTDDAVMRHGVIETNTNFIQKPFTPELLAAKVREILDNSSLELWHKISC